MKLFRTITMALGLSLAAGGALAGTAAARDGDDRQERWRGDDDDDDDNNNGRWERDDDDRGRRWDNDDGGRWDRGDRWGGLVPVRVVNHRHRWVSIYLNGRYLGSVAPNSRQRIAVPAGYQTLVYQVGRSNRFHQVSINAFHGQRNRLVIEGRHGRGRGGWGWNNGW